MGNMTREAAQAVDNRVKQQVLDALKKANDIPVPTALVQQETDGMKRQAAQQFQDPSEVVEYYMGNEQLKTQVKSAILEEKAVEKLLEQANVKDVEMSYQQALAAAQQQA